MIDYIVMDEKLRKDVLDAKAMTGMFEGLDHFVLAKIKGRLKYGRKMARRRLIRC